jgi:hypothetical protein
MIKPFQLHNTFIGKGEATTKTILQTVLNLQDREVQEFPTPGIYSQISFPSLLNNNCKENLGEIHRKSSVDFVVVTNKKQILAVYVNGKDHNGTIKSKRDSIRYSLLQKSKIIVVVIPSYECKNIFLEKLNYLSFLEICSMLQLAGVKA